MSALNKEGAEPHKTTTDFRLRLPFVFTGFLLLLLVDTEDGDDMFLRKSV
jgi:hypothetical protein